MKKYIVMLGVMLLSMLSLTGCSDEPVYEAIVPLDYDGGSEEYPVIYLMPEDGYYLDTSGIDEILVHGMDEGDVMDAIIIKPEFSKESNVQEEMAKVVESVDAHFRTVQEKEQRVIMGTATGGYLAYAVGMQAPDIFGALVSIRGDFASEENPWLETYGDVTDLIGQAQEDYFETVFTYLDAPVDDEWTDMEGATSDLGKQFMEMELPESVHEFTLRAGEFDKEFLGESVARVSESVADYMTGTVEEVVEEEELLVSDEDNKYFYEETFESEVVKKGKYLIYLPKDYYETERFYPTMYLLHERNGSHKTYQKENIEQILNEGIENGMYDEMIVVIPNSSKESWWTGKWEKVLTEELIPHIDKKYRTINDPRFRMAAGFSMGGQGAFSVALTNPEYFSGIASFSGALSMAPEKEEDALLIAEEQTKEYLDYFSYSFICGSHDSFKFGVPAIDLHRTLDEKEIEHNFFIENGEHNSDFYLPYFNECISYVRENMYKPNNMVEKMEEAEIVIDGTKVKVKFEAKEALAEIINQIPGMEQKDAKLSIPLMIQLVSEDEVIYTKTIKKNAITAENLTTEYEFDFAKRLKDVEEFEVVVKACVFDEVVELAREK